MKGLDWVNQLVASSNIGKTWANKVMRAEAIPKRCFELENTGRKTVGSLHFGQRGNQTQQKSHFYWSYCRNCDDLRWSSLILVHLRQNSGMTLALKPTNPGDDSMLAAPFWRWMASRATPSACKLNWRRLGRPTGMGWTSLWDVLVDVKTWRVLSTFINSISNTPQATYTNIGWKKQVDSSYDTLGFWHRCSPCFTIFQVELLLCNPPSISSFRSVMNACDGQLTEVASWAFWPMVTPQELGPSGPSGPSITVIITTSPVPSNPSTDLLERVLQSLYLIPLSAPKIIVCDGYKLAGGRSNPKAGNLDLKFGPQHVEPWRWWFVVCSTSPLHWLIDPDAKARSVHWKPKDMRNISSSFSAVAQETWSRRVLHTFARGWWCCLIGMALVLQWRVLWRKWTLNMSLVGTESNKAVLILADLIASIFSREWLVVMRIRSEQGYVVRVVVEWIYIQM